MRSILSLSVVGAVVVDFFANLSILAVAYPIWREFAYARHPPEYWIRIYFWAAVFATLIVVIVSSLAVLVSHGRPTSHTVGVHVLFTFVALAAIAVAADFSEPDPASSWPRLMQEIAAKFFAELQSIKFTILCASSMALTSGILVFLTLRCNRLGEKGTG